MRSDQKSREHRVITGLVLVDAARPSLVGPSPQPLGWGIGAPPNRPC